MAELIWTVIGYLLGSIPFGLLLTKAAGLGDIRTIGSGNIGTTNVLRTGSKSLAAATLILDAGKGALAVGIAWWLEPEAMIPAAFGAFLGHLFPVWIKFRGGKGVATYLGIALAILPVVGTIFVVVWLLAAVTTRYSSLAGMLAAAACPFTALLTGHAAAALLFFAMLLLLLFRHRDNIARLISGTEHRIGASPKADS